MSTLSCPSCRADVSATSRFCTSCGSPISAAPVTVLPPLAPYDPFACSGCGGSGRSLSADKVYCPECRWLRPLGPGYDLPVDAFMWRFDADAMAVLRNSGPLNAAAHSLSERVGLPWFEASVNGLRLSEQQLPDIFALSIKAARIVGLPYLPEVYVSGEHMWDAVTLGSNESAFIAVGSVLTMFQGDDLLYLLGREMGHAKAGHALWRTVVDLMAGKQAGGRSLMSEGLLSFINPAKLVESGITAPLMAWQRQAEITADRAGLLVVGKIDVVRRVTLQSTLHSFPLISRINMDAWIAQEDASDEMATAASEFVSTSMPYAGRRLKLLRTFAASEEFQGWRRVIEHWLPPAAPAPPPPTSATPHAPLKDAAKLICVACRGPMFVPKSLLAAGKPVNIRCPNPSCGKVVTVSPKPPPKPSSPSKPSAPLARLTCAACRAPMQLPRAQLVGDKPVHVRCPNKACGKVLTITPKAKAPAPPNPPAATVTE